MNRKKVEFITVHVGINVGSNLQAIATSEILKKAGYEPVLVNYIPPRVTVKRYWEGARKSLKKLIWRVLFFPSYYYQKKVFSRYLSRYTVQTQPIYNEDDFSEVLPKADIYMTGSDQVWNFKWNEGYDPHYFFHNIHGVKVAYAASIGMDSLTDEQKTILKYELQDYKKIAVREDKAADILKDLSIESIQLVDPTLMLNREEWFKYIERRIIKYPYLLVYIPYNIKDKEKIYRSVRKIANKRNLKVVTFSWDYRRDRLADKTVFNASPGDFLSLMFYADYIVTNSFHGTAFSINLNKQFWVYSPSMFTSRIGSIIHLLNLESRMIENEISDEAIEESIDYAPVNEKLDIERERAMAFLKSI